MIWNENHPERDAGDLRAYSWRQAAELCMGPLPLREPADQEGA